MNKLLTSLLALQLALMPTITMTAWDGKTMATAYAGGTGSEADPYLISTCEEYAFFANQVATVEGYSKGKFFLLTNDLTFNENVYDRITFRSQLDKPDWPKVPEGYESMYSEWVKVPDSIRFQFVNLTPFVGAYSKDVDGPEIFVPFEGVFDGGGHVLYGVFQDRMVSYNALFPSVEGGVIKNLGIEDAYYVGNSQYGAFAGRMIDSHMLNCYIRHSYVESGGSYGGGLVGMMRGASTLCNCYVEDCVVMGKNGVGGLLGRVGANKMNHCIVENCYANAFLKIKKDEHGALIDGVSDSAIVRNCWYTMRGKATVFMDAAQRKGTLENLVQISEQELEGDELLNALNENAKEIPGACAWVKAESGGPRLNFAGDVTQTWDGTVSDYYAGGDGSSEHPFLIVNASQWAKFAKDVATTPGFSQGKYFKLTADIVLNDSVYDGIERSTRQDKEDLPYDISQWRETPCIGLYTNDTEYTAFQGVFDGDGHTISGMVGELYRSQTYDALFRVLEGATIMNLGLADSYLLSNARLGGLAGRVVDSRIINCYVEHSFIEGGGSQSGAFAGQLLGTSEVLNCYATDMVVFGKNDMGGFIGRIGDSNEHPCMVDNCFSQTELRVKRRNHGAVSFACCTGSTVKNVYYEKLGEITTDFWTDYKLGTVENVRQLSADEFAAAELVDSLNSRAEEISGACRWKQGNGHPIHDYSVTTPDDGSHTAVKDLHEKDGIYVLSDDTIYDLQGRRVTKPQKGLYIQRGRKIIIK